MIGIILEPYPFKLIKLGMVSCALPGVDPDRCVPVCDPSVEECSIESPSGPSYEDAKIVGVFYAT